jgi:hypothetical protein
MKVFVKNVLKKFPDEAESYESTIVFTCGSPLEYFAFYDGDQFIAGKYYEVELDFLDIDPNNNKDTAYSGNKDRAKKLSHLANWSYNGYGQIKSINPTVVDFGEMCLNIGLHDIDQEDVGRYIFWKIDRLDIDTIS